jgi:CheY-like chemotaxis protein
MSAEPAFSILVIDDDPGVLALFRNVSKDLPIWMRFAASAEEGLAMLQAEQPSLVISDYRLPGLDGLSFLERVQALYPKVKRILFTGEAVLRTSVGMDIPVLGKPIPPDALHDLLLDLANDEV